MLPSLLVPCLATKSLKDVRKTCERIESVSDVLDSIIVQIELLEFGERGQGLHIEH